MRLIKITYCEVLYICHILATILPLRLFNRKHKEENLVNYINIFQSLFKINTPSQLYMKITLIPDTNLKKKRMSLKVLKMESLCNEVNKTFKASRNTSFQLFNFENLWKNRIWQGVWFCIHSWVFIP